jgi:hypothetical protein
MRATAVLFSAALMFGCAMADEKASLELISIEGITLKPNERIVAFHIDTWAVAPIMVCQIPYAWTITAGKNSDGAGVISGRGDIWASLFTAEDVGKVRVLAQVWDYRPEAKNGQPPTFKGTLTVWASGTKNVSERRIKLEASNFVHQPANSCPGLGKLAQ